MLDETRQRDTRPRPKPAFEWTGGPAEPILAAGSVHVWAASLLQPPDVIEALERTLSREERSRAERFLVDVYRERFVVGRGLLRAMLRRYLGVGRAKIELRTNSYGKPRLAPPLAATGLHFNLAHSGDVALYAFARGRPIGVDVEETGRDIDHDTIATHFFSPAEIATLAAVPEALKAEAFYLCWTRKEAFLKALGVGLSLPLDCFDVTLTPGAPARLVAVRSEAADAAGWSLRHLVPAPGCVGSLAVEGTISGLHRWTWQEGGGDAGATR